MKVTLPSIFLAAILGSSCNMTAIGANPPLVAQSDIDYAQAKANEINAIINQLIREGKKGEVSIVFADEGSQKYRQYSVFNEGCIFVDNDAQHAPGIPSDKCCFFRGNGTDAAGDFISLLKIPNSPLLASLKGKVKLIWNGWAKGFSLFTAPGPNPPYVSESSLFYESTLTGAWDTPTPISLETFQTLKGILTNKGQIVTSAMDYLSLKHEYETEKRMIGYRNINANQDLGITNIEMATLDIWSNLPLSMNGGWTGNLPNAILGQECFELFASPDKKTKEDVFSFCFLAGTGPDPKLSSRFDVERYWMQQSLDIVLDKCDRRYSYDKDFAEEVKNKFRNEWYYAYVEEDSTEEAFIRFNTAAAILFKMIPDMIELVGPNSNGTYKRHLGRNPNLKKHLEHNASKDANIYAQDQLVRDGRKEQKYCFSKLLSGVFSPRYVRLTLGNNTENIENNHKN